MKTYNNDDYNLANDDLIQYIQQARNTNDPHMIAFIRSLWYNESWESICEKLDTEGSVWIVFWQDGVNAFMRNTETK